MALMFSSTPNIKRAVELINGLDDAKLTRIVSRIIQKLHLDDERAFSADEEEKLEGALGLSSADLELVLGTLEFFMQQAAYHTAKPNILNQQLTQLDIVEQKVQILVDAWTSGAREIIQKFRHRSTAPKQLDSVNWRLNLQMAQKTASKLKIPNVMFEFLLKNQNSDTKDRLRMEFTHDELYSFYNQLETIQKQLDSLT